MSDLEEGEKRVINDRTYSRLKRSFVNLIKSNLEEGKYIRLIGDSFQFIWIFQSKKAISFLYKELFFTPHNSI